MGRSLSVFFVAVLCYSLLSFAMDGCSQRGTKSSDEVQRISKEDLKSRIGDRDTVIIDVRQGGDWKHSDLKIKDAVREDPMEDIESWESKYPKHKRIVLYCA